MLSSVESVGLGLGFADSLSCKSVTSKATMCFEIKRCANYVPIPKQMLCTPYQGFGEPKITVSGWEYANYDVWNEQHEAILADSL